MSADYFGLVRREIAPLLPKQASRIVDVGCGAGETARWLKGLYPAAYVIGLEGNAALRDKLASNVDEAHIVDLNAPLPELGKPDLVLVLDVLEHLLRPEEVLATIAAGVAETGTVVISLPNVAHLGVSLPLLRGRFEYTDAGILDRTHLRFFVLKSAIAMINSAGLRVESGLRAGPTGPRSRVLDFVTGGLLREQLTKQYIMAARPMQSGMQQGEVAWGMV